MKYDFKGWATKNDLRCADGRTIRKNAFKGNDGQKVPLVWQHMHNQPENVLGHAILENRDNGVFAYCSFNETVKAKSAKELVKHGDITQLSIYANKLQQDGGDVLHGVIREVSLVLSGANPGAQITNVVMHSEFGDTYESESEAYITTGTSAIELYHSEEGDDMDKNKTVGDIVDTMSEEQKEVMYTLVGLANDGGSIETKDKTTFNKVIDSMNEEQKNVLYAMVGKATEDTKSAAKHDAMDDDDDADDIADQIFEDEDGDLVDEDGYLVDENGHYLTEEDLRNEENIEEDEKMSRNIFENKNANVEDTAAVHADIQAVLENAAKNGLKVNLDDVIAHAMERGGFTLEHDITFGNELQHGITDLGLLFPEAKTLNAMPDFIKRNTEWVSTVLSGIKKAPFSKIKIQHADITADEARARGYIKGDLKVDEVFSLLERETDATTIYKKQSFDNDDMIDLAKPAFINWVRAEMRLMLNEEIARCILLGDGRPAMVDGARNRAKVDPTKLIPVYNDADLYCIKHSVGLATNATNTQIALAMEEAFLNARKDYKGSGNPILFTTTQSLNQMLLARNAIGDRMYKTEAELATALRVSKIIEVPVMEGVTRTDTSGVEHTLFGLVFNTSDYISGTNAGGAVRGYDNFDIDYNKHKYLMETRLGGMINKPYAAIQIETHIVTSDEAAG